MLRKRLLAGVGITAILLIGATIGSVTLGPVFAKTSSSIPATTIASSGSNDIGNNIDEQQLSGVAHITPDQAKAVVLNGFPGASIGKIQLENENGALVYGVETKTFDGTFLDVKVDANTGKVSATDSNESDRQNNNAGNEENAMSQTDNETESSEVSND